MTGLTAILIAGLSVALAYHATLATYSKGGFLNYWTLPVRALIAARRYGVTVRYAIVLLRFIDVVERKLRADMHGHLADIITRERARAFEIAREEVHGRA